MPYPVSCRKRARRVWLKGIWLAVLFALLAPAIVTAEESSPDPLGLDRALAYAEEHPRVLLGNAAPDLPRRPPLYLDCERLALIHLDSQVPGSRRTNALIAPLSAQRMEIMERYLDVLLADLSQTRFNEALAVAFIQYDRSNTRRELGQHSELLVAELETAYQDVLRKHAASELGQRLTRALLAQAMGRPGELPRDLRPPQLEMPPDELPDLDTVLTQIPAPVLSEPTADGAAGSAPVQARSHLYAMELHQQALELLLRLQALKAAVRYAESESFLRDLKLDESRALYEQEVKSDLGFSMSRQTRARFGEERIRYCRALAWAELNALQGRAPASATRKEATP